MTTPNRIRLPAVPLPATGLDIWRVPFPGFPDRTDEHLLTGLTHCLGDCLSKEEHTRLQSRRLPEARFQFVFTRVVLRHLLSSYHPEVAPGQWQISRSDTGRPHLSRAQTPLAFNLTHTDDCLMFAFSQYADPGIDIELFSRSIEFDTIAKRYFSVDEYRSLQQLPDAARAEFFFRLWTLKEAAVKASGLGLAGGLRRFQFRQPGGASFTHLVDTTDSDGFLAAQSAGLNFWSACFQGHALAVALMSHQAGDQSQNMIDITPFSRNFIWPDVVTEISPLWIKSQSRNSSTNLEP